jgi:hypothetical protein
MPEGAPHTNPAPSGLLSWKEVEEQMVAAVRMLRRLPSGGRWPFASDGPWHLITREARAGQWDGWRQEIEAAEVRELRNVARTVPLTAEEVDWMEGRLAWLLAVPERDRALVATALTHHAFAGSRIRWAAIRAQLAANRNWREVAGSDRGLGQRYARAIARIAAWLNGSDRSAAHIGGSDRLTGDQPCRRSSRARS